jgi:signal transduction histidine kinase
MKHTPPDARVWISTLDRGDAVEIVVEDDGAGLSPDVREWLFRPFTHGATTPSHAPGVGVGLTLVGRFANLHGGRAWAEDRPDGGVSFHVLLPGRTSESRNSGATTRRPAGDRT